MILNRQLHDKRLVADKGLALQMLLSGLHSLQFIDFSLLLQHNVPWRTAAGRQVLGVLLIAVLVRLTALALKLGPPRKSLCLHSLLGHLSIRNRVQLRYQVLIDLLHHTCPLLDKLQLGSQVVNKGLLRLLLLSQRV